MTMCVETQLSVSPGACYGDSGGPITLLDSNIQVGIVSFGSWKCYDHRFPNGFTRVSEVADWVKETVCAKVGELCKQSKSGKNSKGQRKKYPDTCVPVPTEAPSAPWPTWSPTATAQPTTTPQPFTPWPTWSPTYTTDWPTWMPTKAGKAEKDRFFD